MSNYLPAQVTRPPTAPPTPSPSHADHPVSVTLAGGDTLVLTLDTALMPDGGRQRKEGRPIKHDKA